MKSSTLRLGILLTIPTLILAACGGASPTPAPAQPTEAMQATSAPAATAMPTEASMSEATLKIGFTTSQTGSLNTESVRQANGLKLWMDQVNSNGGIQVGNTMVKFEAVTYDDESSKDRVQELYTRLATQDNVDFMISPYSSGLTGAAAVIAEQNQKVMITTGAAADSAYQQGYTLVFQAYTPASKYLSGAIDQLMTLDPSAKNVAFMYENSSFSTSVVTAAKDYAEAHGFNVEMFDGYDPGTTDFSALINKVSGLDPAPDAILGGGHFADGSTLARQLGEKNVSVKYLALLVAPPEPDFAQIGDAAVGVVGPSQWEPDAAYSADAASSMGIPYVGPTVADFVSAYKAAYNEDPSYHSAGGYAAGLLLQTALENAGSTDTQAVAAALNQMDVMTFFGTEKFDTSAENHGLQIGHEMVYIQWQKDSSGNLVKEIVWPEGAATASAVYPKP
ncbi:MAG: amino acid ABC transporter substrate-binding protein [Anaerolineales bacterium]|jgi:branched-chain amino acid transport system substrate-binding protein